MLIEGCSGINSIYCNVKRILLHYEHFMISDQIWTEGEGGGICTPPRSYLNPRLLTHSDSVLEPPTISIKINVDWFI